MDFKSLISKLDSMDPPPKTPAAPTIDRAVRLNEDAQLRVLSGQTTYVSEAKKKKDEEVKEADDMKVGDKKNIATGTVEKTKTGIVHKSSKAYGGSEEKEDDDEDDKPKKKAKKESVEPEFKSKFMKMVEAKKEEAADKKKKMAKKEKMAEGAKPDVLDLDKDGDKKEPMKKAAGEKGGDKKDSGKKGMSDKQAKYFGGKTESKMMPKDKKKTVKESVEQKLSFKQMVQLVQESGGQQQIDPMDKALFTWAERVAKNKLGEGMKADLYAGLVYERNGGVFEMYDVLSEHKINEAAKYRDAKYKDKLYTQEPRDEDDYGSDDDYYNPKPDDYPGAKHLKGGGEYDHNDPLRRGDGIGRSGIKHSINTHGKRKGLPNRDQITSLKSSIKGAKGSHSRPNLP